MKKIPSGVQEVSFNYIFIVFSFSCDTSVESIFTTSRYIWIVANILIILAKIKIKEVIIIIVIIIYLVLNKLFDWKSNILFILDK